MLGGLVFYQQAAPTGLEGWLEERPLYSYVQYVRYRQPFIVNDFGPFFTADDDGLVPEPRPGTLSASGLSIHQAE